MIDPAKNALAAMVGERWADFQMPYQTASENTQPNKSTRSIRRKASVQGGSSKVGRDPTKSSKKATD
jgi:hypothetical protein